MKPNLHNQANHLVRIIRLNKKTVMRKTLFLLSILLSSSCIAQQWVNCTSGHRIKDIVYEDNIIWVATTGGLVRNNLTDNASQFFNRGNSPIPSNNMFDVELDTSGTIWMVTDRGAAKFDGNNWALFYEKNGILQLDHENNMLIVETDSLHKWNGETFESTSLPFDQYYLLTDVEVEASTGDLWLTYYTFGVYVVIKYNATEFTMFNHQNAPLPFESPMLNPLLIDSENQLWAGNQGGLFRYVDSTWQSVTEFIPTFPSGRVTALELAPDGSIWAIVAQGLINAGQLIKIENDTTITFFEFPEALATDNRVQALEVIDKPSMPLLLGSEYFGLWQYDQNGWGKRSTDQSPALSNNVSHLFTSGEAAFISNGNNTAISERAIFSITEGEWLFYDDGPFTLSELNYPRLLSKGPNDTLWVYSGATLFAYLNEEWYPANIPDIIEDVDEMNSLMHYTPTGERWLLQNGNNYLFYESEQGWQAFDQDNHGIEYGGYNHFFNHPQTGDFWVATVSGISRYDGLEWHKIKPNDLGLPSNWVNGMAVDANGIVWATTSHAVLRIEDNTPEVFTIGIPDNPNRFFGALTLDSLDRLWVGMNDAIALYNADHWEVLDIYNSGVPNSRISALDFDTQGNLWIGSTHGGFAIFNPNGLPNYLLDDFHTATTEQIPTSSQSSLFIYPNPTNEGAWLNVEITAMDKISASCSYILYNNLGEVVKNGKILNKQFRVSVQGNLSPGIYFLQVQNGTKIYLERVVVQ